MNKPILKLEQKILKGQNKLTQRINALKLSNAPKKKKKRTRPQTVREEASRAGSDNTAKWLQLVGNPMVAPAVGVVPPYGHFNEGWWVTRRATTEFTISIAAGYDVMFAAVLNTAMPLQIITTNAGTPYSLPSLIYSGTAGANTIGYNASLCGSTVYTAINNFYQAFYNQTTVTNSQQGAANEQCYAPTYSDSSPLPFMIPLIGHVEAVNTTPMTSVGGVMLADIACPQVYNAGAGLDDTAVNLKYVVGDQALQTARKKMQATTNAFIESTAVCDETVFSNASPAGLSSSLNGSARGAAWLVLRNPTANVQTYQMRASFIYLLEPLASSGLFDLAVRPQALVADAHPAVTMTKAIASAPSEAMKEVSNVANLGKDVVTGNYGKAITDVYKVGASAVKLSSLFRR